MSKLHVYFRDQLCGLLEEDPQGRLRFSYLESWLDIANTPASLSLPLRSGWYENAEVAPFVANLLPEGRGLRNQLERLLHVDANHDFGLLARIGWECAGALSFWPEDLSPGSVEQSYAPLELASFHDWREFAQRQPFQFHGEAIRMSLAGFQAKTALYFDPADTPFVPLNGAPTTHIIKPRMVGCEPNTVYVEYLCMQLARAVLGQEEVPQSGIWETCYRIQRYDRPRSGGQVQRLHQEDFCLALGRMPSGKYEGGSPQERLLAPCFDLIDRLGAAGTVAAPALQRQRLLRQIILNVLLHNPDAHLKNYSLLFDEVGAVRVAPLYDCLCTHGLVFRNEGSAWAQDSRLAAHTSQLSLQIGHATDIRHVRLEDWQQFARECGFTGAYVKRQVRELGAALLAALPLVIEGVLQEFPKAETAAETAAHAIREAVLQTHP